ncbi:MarR family winged helix-turn-helix transcriptional regulator [Lactobacillus psittaci]|uniref:L-fucose operon regulator n=1 Tax=Lactobacillus psittaci DSM 15354 TaxID=1122152 RepID=A0A0R1SAJ5_9LACO|nr:MarR family transcriptional regulator [Lactobacillus psittaci]KRL63618.1 L-fucose operon regulator [Lactobacillus psittaci DSM 15354]
MDVLHFNEIAESIKKRILHNCGLNLSQTRLLLYFGQNGNQELTMGKLACNLNISLSTLSRQLQQGRTKTLIQVLRSETDSSKTVKLNEVGIQKYHELIQLLDQIHNELFSSLKEQESKNFQANLQNIVNHLGVSSF